MTSELRSLDLQALKGLRVLDVATFLAAPFCGTIMADFGADVIKIEQPEGGDSLRRFGTPAACGDTYMWMSEARNKRFVTLDLRTEEGAAVFKDLIRQSDVLLENFRPGTLEKWGLGYDVLSAINPGLILLRVSAYGQDGPMRNEPGFARIAHAFGGLAYLAGEQDGAPVVPGSTSLADYISGLWGAIGVLLALNARHASGRGQVVDIGLYESVFRLLDEIAPVYSTTGYVRERLGADVPHVAPHSHYRCRCGGWVAIACSNDRMFERRCQAMGRQELAVSPDYARASARAARRAEVNGIVADWAATLELDTLQEICRREGVPCSKVYSIADIFADPQYRARGNLQEVNDPRFGKAVIPAAIPRLSHTPAVFSHAGRALGADNASVYEELLGMSGARLADLKARGVV